MEVSIILPVYNEEVILEKNLDRLRRYMNDGPHDFEILICDNGSTDKTRGIVQSLAARHPEIIYVHVPEKGLGLGIKAGIENARFGRLYFYAIDLPFGLEAIEESLKASVEYDIVIGSKGHRDSINGHTVSRKCYSFILNRLVNFFFHLNISDTQGSLLFRKDQVMEYLQHLDARGPFFQTQILIYGKHFRFTVCEIPVKYPKARKGSRINPLRDGMACVGDLFREIVRLKKLQSGR